MTLESDKATMEIPPPATGSPIVALSDSSVTTGSSVPISSPSLTRISITGTSLKSPMSGTLTSIDSIGSRRRTVAGLGIAGRGGGVLLAAVSLGRIAAPPSASSRTIRSPSETLVAGLHLDLADRAGLRGTAPPASPCRTPASAAGLPPPPCRRSSTWTSMTRHVLEVADIGDADFDHAHGQLSSLLGTVPAGS